MVSDRLLARLVETAPGRWLLKGGFALELRLAGRARATRDVDIDWRRPEEELIDALIDAASHDPGDFFLFTLERVGIPEDRLGGSHRFRVSASLAGRPFDTFLLDVGFRRDAVARLERLTAPDLLGFADIEPVTVTAIPLEVQLAEKLHAYTRVYEGRRVSTRTKDLVDMVLIAHLSHLDAAVLKSVIEATFVERDEQAVPDAMPRPPATWRVPFRQLAQAVGVPTQLDQAHASAAALLDPVLGGHVTHGTWSAAGQEWTDDCDGREQDDAELS